MENKLESVKHRISAAILCAALLLAGLSPTPAHAATAYEVHYRGAGVPMVEEEADFFGHMDPFVSGRAQGGEFVFTNDTEKACVLQFGLEEAVDESKGALVGLMQLAIEDKSGSTVYEGPLDGSIAPSPMELAKVAPGETVSWAFTVAAPETLTQEHAGESATVKWAFYVQDDAGEITRQDGAQLDKNYRPLPKTGDENSRTAAAAICGTASALLLLYVAARRLRERNETTAEIREKKNR